MKTITVCALLLFACGPPETKQMNLPLQTSSVTHDSGSPFEVTVSRDPNSRSIVQVRLVNRSANSLELYAARLPWGNSSSMFFLALTRPEPSSTLPESQEFDEARPGTVTIRPGESVSGTIDLARRFPTLGQALSSGPVMMFWTYELRTSEPKTLGRVFGGLLLPKSS